MVGEMFNCYQMFSVLPNVQQMLGGERCRLDKLTVDGGNLTPVRDTLHVGDGVDGVMNEGLI